MSRVLRLRRGTTAETSTFTGKLAELTVDTDKMTVVVHDNVTAGGHALLTENYITSYKAVSASSPTAPTNPTSGTLWYDTVSGRLYVYYGSAWVDASPVATSVNVGNLLIEDNMISAVNTNADINLSTNGTGAVRVTSGKLHVESNYGISVGDANQLNLKVLAPSLPYNPYTTAVITTSPLPNPDSNIGLQIYSEQSNYMFFNPESGNIGVNRYTPNYKFHVGGSVGGSSFSATSGITYSGGFNFGQTSGLGSTGLFHSTNQYQVNQLILQHAQAPGIIVEEGGNVFVPGHLQIGNVINFPATNANLQFADSKNDVVQFMVQNRNSGNSASGDIVITADNGSDSEIFIDMGINSSNYNQAAFSLTGPNDGYLYVHGSPTSGHGNLVLATMHNHDIVFATNGQSTGNEIGRWKDGEGLIVKGNANVGNLNANTNITVNGTIVTGAIKTDSYYYANGQAFIGGTGALPPGTTVPSQATDGTLWFDTLSGHLYVRYANTWVDTTILPSSDIDRLTSNGHELVLDTDGNLALPAIGGSIYAPNVSSGTGKTITVRAGTTTQMAQTGGSIVLQAGNGSVPTTGFDGNIQLKTSRGTWTFEQGGLLTLSAGSDIRDSQSNISVLKTRIGDRHPTSGDIHQLAIARDEGKLITIAGSGIGVFRLPQMTADMLGAEFEFYFDIDAGQIHIHSYYTGVRATTDVFRGSIYVGVDNATTGKLHKATATTSTACDLFLGQHHAKAGSYIKVKAIAFGTVGTWLFQGMCIGDTGQTPNGLDHPFQDYN
jgi:hypothetical protein